MLQRTRGRQRAVLAAPDAPKRRHKPDYGLAVLMLMLLAIGLIVIYSISPGLAATRGVGENYYTQKQLISIGLGAFTFAVMAITPLAFWRRIAPWLVIVAGVATIIALLMPVTADYPAHRWIRLGGLSFQSVELVKFAVIFALSGFLVQKLHNTELTDTKRTLRPLLIGVLAGGFIIAKLQSDFGSAAVLAAMIAAMSFVAGLPFKRILLIGGILAVGAVLAISTTAYRRDRLLTFMHPERDCVNVGYQACQALIAVGSGGIAGKGLGHSVQAYGYLPEAPNDSIFAIYAEKFGFLGVMVLFGLFAAFFSRLRHIIERAPDDYSRLVVVGVLAWLSTQTLINIGAMIGVLPMKGITLPFISYGGTSIIFTTAAVGLVFQISRYTSYAPRTNDETRETGRATPVAPVYSRYNGARRG